MICGLHKQHSSLGSDSTPNMTTMVSDKKMNEENLGKRGKGVGRLTENTTLFLLAYYEQNAD
jgi:hypothetical protein